jgi:hypothetical protein
MELKDFDAALKDFDKAIQIRPDSGRAILGVFCMQGPEMPAGRGGPAEGFET